MMSKRSNPPVWLQRLIPVLLVLLLMALLATLVLVGLSVLGLTPGT
jgi:hypothetical protein